MNKEQLQFFYNEIMGLLGWDDGDEASGVDPLLWAKKEYEIRNVKLAQLRAELDLLKIFAETLHVKMDKQDAELDAANKAVEEARAAMFLHNLSRPSYHAFDAWLTAHPKEQE